MVEAAVREASGGSRRDQILEETARIIGERGYHGFGIQELAQRCGLTKQGLLHYFPSKDQMLIAMLRDRDRQDQLAVTALTDLALPHPGTEPPSRARIVAALHAIVERNSMRPAIVRLYAMLRGEALNPDHPAHAHFRAWETATLDRFTQILAGHSPAPRSTARQLFALMTGLELQWLRDDLAFDMIAEWERGVAGLLP